MELAGAGLRLASSAFTPLIRRLFRQDGPGAGLVERPVRISSLVSFRGEKRSIGQADLARLCEELVRRAVRGMGPHDAPSEDELLATADLLARTLAALGELDMDDAQAVRLGHEEFARRIAISDEPLYLRVLGAVCLHILNFFTQRSTFVARTLVEQSRQLDRLARNVDLLIERVPDLSREDITFENRYARYVEHEHGQLTIYGLDLQQSREWPLDDAYLSLEIHGDPDGAPRRAERALAGRERVLLRGMAGSGKTTLVQWLAVTSARQDLSAGMPHLMGRIPFVLPMRTLTRDRRRLPEPDQFLSVVDCPLAAAQPERWMDRVLSAGRALLLVDGIDEIPEHERDAARAWLRRLNASYPGNLWLVTARPSAVRQDWLGSEAFAELALSPMSQSDVQAFVHRWHQAVGAVPETERALLDLIHSRADLGALASSPLMCALICALHRERNGYLPRGRKALYDAALSMLLERRDRERPDPPRGDLTLDSETQLSLLQKLAFWLITNGRSEMTGPLAARLIGQALPAIHQGDRLGSPEDVLRHLVERSGVLREPTEGAVDFMHRTFQDYLGAREMVEWQHFPALVEKAHLDQWEDVVRMAVAHAQPVQRGELLTALIDRGDADQEHRVRLHLLAMACLEHSTQLAPDIRARITRKAGEYLPPRTRSEAGALVNAGSVILDLLPGPEELTESEAYAVVFAATRLGTDAALTRLCTFRDHPSPNVRQLLATAWYRFDTERYFEEIVARLPRHDDIDLPATSAHELRLLGTLDGLASVSLRGLFGATEITLALADQPVLSTLALRDNASVSALDFLREFPGLSTLVTDNCPALDDYDPLKGTSVTALHIHGDSPGPTPRGLTPLTGLTRIVMGPTVRLSTLRDLPGDARLAELTLPARFDLQHIGSWPTLTALGVQHSARDLRQREWERLASLPRLRSIALTPLALRQLHDSGAVLARVDEVHLVWEGALPVTATELARLLAALPALRTLVLSESLRELPNVPGLRRIRVPSRTAMTSTLPNGVELIAPPAPRY
ncbi:NACHT domain-containing protein [Streptomyces sp. 8K308]|uniref:NACHT domain-containing protein n=1 Tax=Streptomyces sp. 8K308 TaxID=2530388 RepID=UPI001045893A|nr:NACHT domain-containing protein [Streptomyces sp. 8K308]TDC12753.1 NACHT domain-containing protein [Streptomyces sp. 8K308]